MGKYKVYHIPDFVYPNGRIGKVGCSKDIKVRMRANLRKSLKPFDFWEILEEYDCKRTAGKRERQLQIEYGYTRDKTLYKGAVGRRKNYSQSEETKMKISQTLKGRVHSKEERMNNSKAKSGSGNPMSKLNEEKVLWIRNQYKRDKDVFGKKITQKRLADAVGVAQGWVSYILSEKSWSHI